MVTIGLFVFAWTIGPSIHWIGAIIGSVVFGAGYAYNTSTRRMLFPLIEQSKSTGIFTFLDAYPEYAASALAANRFARSTFGGIKAAPVKIGPT